MSWWNKGDMSNENYLKCKAAIDTLHDLLISQSGRIDVLERQNIIFPVDTRMPSWYNANMPIPTLSPREAIRKVMDYIGIEFRLNEPVVPVEPISLVKKR